MAFLCTLQVAGWAAAYRPVILMHGVDNDAGEMRTIQDLLQDDHKGTVTTSLAVFEHRASLTPLDKQVRGVMDAVRNLVSQNTSLYANGYHFVCKSQARS